MDFIKNNWQFVFGGLGTAIVAAAIAAYLKYYFDKKTKAQKSAAAISQEIQSGSGSLNVQAGRDAKVTSGKARNS